MKWVVSAIIAITVAAVVLGYFGKDISSTENVPLGARCLQSGEKVIYDILDKGRPGRVRVSVVDAASTTVWSREMAMHDPQVANGFSTRNCHFYIHQAFNYDYQNEQTLRGFEFHIWQFPYFESSEGRSVVMTSHNQDGTTGQRVLNYGREFIVDPSEKYISLERGTLGKPDYALVVKNIETGADEYALTLADVLKDHPNAAGSFDVGAWVTRPDGTYLSTIIYDGSRWMAYIYVKLGTWETEIYETPSDYMAGVERSAPPFAPLLAYTDVITWAGIDTVTDELLDEQIASGQKKHLILANLKTGEKTVLEEVPIVRDHRFNLKWLSDTELQYTMPDGVIKTYRVQ